MNNWLHEIYDDLATKNITNDMEDDFKFMKKQMMLRFKSRRYQLSQTDLAGLNMIFAFNWLKEFAPIEEA